MMLRTRRIVPVLLTGLLLGLGCACGPVANRASFDDSKPVALRLGFSKGETIRYRFQFKLAASATGSLASALAGNGGSPNTDVTGVESFTVVSVDRQGTATVQVHLLSLSGRVAGRSVSPRDRGSFQAPSTIRITKDGRVPGGSGANGTGSISPLFGSLGGADSSSVPDPSNLGALLAEGKVKPGDTWSQDSHVPLSKPGQLTGLTGDVTFAVKNTFARYEDLNGAHDAVIQTSVTVPVNATFDLSRLFDALAAQSGYQRGAGAKPQALVIRLVGTGGGQFKTWFNAAANRLDRLSGGGQEDVNLSFQGVPSGSGIPSGSSSGTITVRYQASIEKL